MGKLLNEIVTDANETLRDAGSHNVVDVTPFDDVPDATVALRELLDRSADVCRVIVSRARQLQESGRLEHTKGADETRWIAAFVTLLDQVAHDGLASGRSLDIALDRISQLEAVNPTDVGWGQLSWGYDDDDEFDSGYDSDFDA